jgi:threonine aldolase
MVRAVRARRMLGGAMRQSGILAAAGLYALDHNIGQLAEDHANARLIAERLVRLSGVALDLATVQTNIVVFRLDPGLPDAASIVGRAREAGVLVSALGARTVRAVTHRDASRADCQHAADRLVGVINDR